MPHITVSRADGVEDIDSSTITSKLGGCFKQTDVRSEFMRLASVSNGN